MDLMWIGIVFVLVGCAASEKNFTKCEVEGEELCHPVGRGPHQDDCYDPARMYCCGGRLSRRTKYSACCYFDDEEGYGELYDSSKSMCCGGRVFDDPRDELGCCLSSEPQPFNRTYEICCGNVVHNRLVGVEPFDSCCGPWPYVKDTHLCCEEGPRSVEPLKYSLTPYDPSKRLICCDSVAVDAHVDTCKESRSEYCGGTPYNTANQLCCQDHLLVRPSGYWECCGAESYDVRTKTCCHDDYIIAPYVERTVEGETVQKRQSCCASRSEEGEGSIVEGESLCCNGHPHALTHLSLECCGDGTIDTRTHGCCGGQVYATENFTCCGETLLPRESQKVCCAKRYPTDPATHICCPTQPPQPKSPHFPERDTCCEHRRKGSRTNIYDSATEICIDGLVHSKDSHVCGRAIYEPENYLCCNGVLHMKQAGLKCCGIRAYYPMFQTCCHGHPQQGAENSHWCRGKDAVPIATSCPTGEAVCGSRCYDTDTMYCCHYAGFPRRNPPEGRSKQCPCGHHTGHRRYNPEHQICSAGSVVGKRCVTVLTEGQVDTVPLQGLAYKAKTKRVNRTRKQNGRRKTISKIRLFKLKPLSRKLAAMDKERYEDMNIKATNINRCPGSPRIDPGTSENPGTYLVVIPPGVWIKSALLLPYTNHTAQYLRKQMKCEREKLRSTSTLPSISITIRDKKKSNQNVS